MADPLRLVLEPVAVELAAAASSSPETPAQDPNPPRARSLGGLAVPYEIERLIGFQGRALRVTFAAGSVEFRDRAPLLLGHDPNQPIGVLESSELVDGGVRGTWSVDATSAGDAALVQARSGSRAGLSVGVDVEAGGFEYPDPEDPDRIRVTAGTAVETSLVSLAGFEMAGVDEIAAGKPNGGTKMSDLPNPEPTPAPDPEPTPAPEPTDPDAIAGRVLQLLEQRRPRLVVAEAEAPSMRLGEYVATVVQAQRGDQGARARIEAALTRQTVATEPGVIPIAYVTELVDSIGASRPLFESFSRAEMPPAGMLIRRPAITTRPDGQWLADDTAGMPSGALTIGQLDTAIKQWAWGGSASVALVERSMPSYVEEAFGQMLKSYYRDVETELASKLPTAIPTVPLESIGGGVAAFMAAYREAPTLIVAGGNAYGAMLDSIGSSRFASGSIDASGVATLYGMRLVASADVAPDDLWITSPDFLESRESSPLRLTVADVGGLSVEIGLTAFFAATQTRETVGETAGAVHLSTYTPPAALAAGGEARGGRK